MSRRFHRLLGGFAVVTILAVSLAATSAGAPARVSGSGNSNGGGDNVPPTSYWGSNWNGIDNHGRYWKGWNDGQGDFNGGSFDNSMDAFHPGKVAHVMVAVDRVSGSRCRHMSATGRLGRAGSCNSSNWVQAKGTNHWSYHIGRKLPKGRYSLRRQAVDVAGNREQPHVLRLRIGR